ncbi:MAG TPA: SMP-30/gluconolactonase/LRE family protein [Planctomycetaceae bacterium]|nr:SMP-30/gluconolactonase/LRE family protein [Planctomycetaceae bacterium]HQZ64009.1 SMP-30/gluconolactonase/LRE family protein [Planctomycetaceae bacterium]
MIVRCLIAVLLAGGACLSAEQIPGIGPVGDVTKLHTGFEFTEGPTADAAGNLYFTDIPNQRIHKLDSQNQLSVFAENSGYSNGLMVVGDRLLACEMNGKLKEYRLADAEQTTLAEQFEGKRFNAPNDLVIDRTGGIYFTDPRFRAPEKLPQGKEAVYYRAADGTVMRLLDDRKAPNGVILSPDESTLYVIPSMEKQMWAYPVEAPGKIGAGKVLCELQQRPGQDNGGGDGLTIDTKGNLYITSALGIQVVSPDGKIVGIIEIPEQPANVTFGGTDHRTLFVTARKSLYAVPMESIGHVFSGPAAK